MTDIYITTGSILYFAVALSLRSAYWLRENCFSSNCWIYKFLLSVRPSESWTNGGGSK